MNFLDLYQGDQEASAAIWPNEAHDLPATFDQTFAPAWRSGRLFGQSIAHSNARAEVLHDYIREIREKTGNDLSREFMPDVAGGGQTGVTDFDTANERVAKLKQDYPDLDLAPLSNDEIDKRAIAKSREAQGAYAAMSAREKTLGGSLGMFTGSLAAGATDPINVLALPVAPAAGLGILATALRWGAIAGTTQAAIEGTGSQYREQVQPGASQESLGNIGEAILGGAAFGGTIKALGNVWGRVKTGEWPRSVRDAGNIAESEANLADTNILPGVEGEVAHRDAVVKTIDDILAGRPVDVSGVIPRDIAAASQGIMDRLTGARGISIPVFNERSVRLISEEAGLRARGAELNSQIENLPQSDLAAVDRLNRLEAVESQLAAEGLPPEAKRALNERRDQILVDTTPEQLRAGAASFEQERKAKAELGSIGSRLTDITNELRDMQHPAAPMLGQTEPISNARGQFEMPLEQPISESARTKSKPVQSLPELVMPKALSEMLVSPDHETAVRADIDRARMTGDFKVPIGIDEQGNVIHRSVDEAMNEVDAYKNMGEQIAACAAPAKEAAE